MKNASPFHEAEPKGKGTLASFPHVNDKSAILPSCFAVMENIGRNSAGNPPRTELRSMPNKNLSQSRYSIACPVCGARFHPAQFVRGLSTFNCPDCDALLEYETENILLALWPISMIVTGIVALYLGYRGLTLVLVTIAGSFLIFVLRVFVAYQIHPSKVRQTTKNRDTDLNLTGRPRR
jgi:hypothetical protein